MVRKNGRDSLVEYQNTNELEQTGTSHHMKQEQTQVTQKEINSNKENKKLDLTTENMSKKRKIVSLTNKRSNRIYNHA